MIYRVLEDGRRPLGQRRLQYEDVVTANRKKNNKKKNGINQKIDWWENAAHDRKEWWTRNW